MATRIKLLPEELVNKIAAGEVVERPASVVKELVENAIDAGSHDITIDIRGGGRSLIQVTDDGLGMSRDDALLAIERHATSKIASTEDLFSIRTLGFRGEALAAIAGVSRFELVTRQAEAEQGSRVFAQGGMVRQVEGVVAPVGTTITVKDLFFNTPARLKFLKSAAVETGHIIDIVMRLAMSHNDVRFTLLRGPETLVQTTRESTGMARLLELLGSELSGQLHPFRGERAGMRVEGFLSGPEVCRAGWSGLYAFVNRRFLRDRLVSKAVGEAYKGSIPKGRYPVAVVFLTVDPQEVDVNVHPGKIEVRFARPRNVSDLIVESMHATLVRSPWRRAAGGLGVSFQKNPTLFGDGLPRFTSETPRQLQEAEFLLEDLRSERQGVRQGQLLAQDAPEMDSPWERSGNGGSVDPASSLPTGVRGTTADGSEPPFDPEEEAARIESLTQMEPPPEVLARRNRELARRTGTSLSPSSFWQSESPPVEARPASGMARAQAIPPLSPPPAQAPRDAQSSAASDIPGTDQVLSSVADASPPVVQPAPRRLESAAILPGFEVRNFSRMRLIGQYANCFILCQDGDELVIIDQHAAHERVTFEQLRAAYEGLGARNQLLLTPRVVELPRREAEVLTDHLETLDALGMEVEPFGGRTFAVKSMPVALSGEDPGGLLQELAADLTGDISSQPLNDRIYLMLATMACHGSIRANRKMAFAEMDALLKLLDGTDFAYACPHGRPLVARSSRKEVERLFKRT